MSEQPITTSRRLVYNTFFNVATLVSHAVIAFLLIRFFLSQLGKAQYGVWLLIGGSIFKYAPLLSLGLSSSINRYIPVYLAKNDNDGVRRVISTSWSFFAALAVVLIIISLVVYRNVGSWFAIEPELVQTAGRLVLIVGFCFAFAMPLQPSTAILSGLQRYDVSNLLALVALFLRTIVVVVLLLQGYGLLAIGLVFGLSEITLRALHQIFVRRMLPTTSRSIGGKIDLGLLKEMLAYGINTFLYTMGAIIIQNTSILIIGIFMSTNLISQFTVAFGGVFLLSQLLQAFTAAIKPAVSDLDARNDHLRVKEIAFLTQKYSLLLLFPSGCFLVMMGREFLQIWVGDQFKDPGDISQMAAVLTILTIGYCLMLAQHSNFLVLVGRGQHRIFGVLTALMALLCVSMSIVSVKVFNWGLIGIAWSNFLPILLISGMTLPIYFNRKMHISWFENLRDVWRPALLGSLPAVTCIGLWKYLAPPSSWLQIGGVVAASALLTAAGGWFLTLTELERRRFIGMAMRKKNHGSN
jgi:O-antigen/teichoic acid export membrane protein